MVSAIEYYGVAMGAVSTESSAIINDVTTADDDVILGVCVCVCVCVCARACVCACM